MLRPPPRFSERSNVAPSLFAFRGDQIREIERGERITTAKMGKLFGRGRFGSKREKSDRGRSNRIGEISPGNHASASNRSYRLDSLMPRRARATTVRPSISRFFTKTARGMSRSKERRVEVEFVFIIRLRLSRTETEKSPKTARPPSGKPVNLHGAFRFDLSAPLNPQYLNNVILPSK